MTSKAIIARFKPLKQLQQYFWQSQGSKPRPPLSYWAEHPEQLPEFVQQSPVAWRYLQLLAPLAWEQLPKLHRRPNGLSQPLSVASFAGACLVKLDQQLVSMGRLHQYLQEHPALIWLLGFPLSPSSDQPWGFDPQRSLPTARHLTRLLRHLPNPLLQFLLDSSISLIQGELAEVGLSLGQQISMDTKHILAWVKENNPKAYLAGGRYDKSRQPIGDPDCRLGCKRRRNQRASSKKAPPTPADEPLPAATISVAEYYWGYGSGVVATKVADWAEVVLAELTQPFDQPDVSYFLPLMQATEQRLGFRPKYAAFDAAFDAFYVYDYFHSPQHDGFAAIPASQRGGFTRDFDPEGLPLCQAGLAMPLKSTFMNNRALVPQQMGRYVCPLLFPEPTGQTCPIDHKKWPKGGCILKMGTSPGARLRYLLDRDSQAYKQLYKQRTANERINSQALALGIERPKLRNGQAITNLNTLIYILINLRALHRIRQRKAHLPGAR